MVIKHLQILLTEEEYNELKGGAIVKGIKLQQYVRYLLMFGGNRGEPNRETMRQRRREGKSYGDIAKEFNISKARTWNLINKEYHEDKRKKYGNPRDRIKKR